MSSSTGRDRPVMRKPSQKALEKEKFEIYKMSFIMKLSYQEKKNFFFSKYLVGIRKTLTNLDQYSNTKSTFSDIIYHLINYT